MQDSGVVQVSSFGYWKPWKALKQWTDISSIWDPLMPVWIVKFNSWGSVSRSQLHRGRLPERKRLGTYILQGDDQ